MHELVSRRLPGRHSMRFGLPLAWQFISLYASTEFGVRHLGFSQGSPPKPCDAILKNPPRLLCFHPQPPRNRVMRSKSILVFFSFVLLLECGWRNRNGRSACQDGNGHVSSFHCFRLRSGRAGAAFVGTSKSKRRHPEYYLITPCRRTLLAKTPAPSAQSGPKLEVTYRGQDEWLSLLAFASGRAHSEGYRPSPFFTVSRVLVPGARGKGSILPPLRRRECQLQHRDGLSLPVKCPVKVSRGFD